MQRQRSIFKKGFSVRNKGIFLLCMLFFVSLLLFGAMVRADNVEEAHSLYKYYTSVPIHPGDTLWGIASEYCHDSVNLRTYMEELRQINHLKNDEIHAGRYLTVIYYSEEYK